MTARARTVHLIRHSLKYMPGRQPHVISQAWRSALGAPTPLMAFEPEI
jgi:hypothetical protein